MNLHRGKAVELVGGNDVTIIACGALVGPAVQAAKLLAEQNVKARVLNMASIKPIDADAIVKAAKAKADEIKGSAYMIKVLCFLFDTKYHMHYIISF